MNYLGKPFNRGEIVQHYCVNILISSLLKTNNEVVDENTNVKSTMLSSLSAGWKHSCWINNVEQFVCWVKTLMLYQQCYPCWINNVTHVESTVLLMLNQQCWAVCLLSENTHVEPTMLSNLSAGWKHSCWINDAEQFVCSLRKQNQNLLKDVFWLLKLVPWEVRQWVLSLEHRPWA